MSFGVSWCIFFYNYEGRREHGVDSLLLRRKMRGGYVVLSAGIPLEKPLSFLQGPEPESEDFGRGEWDDVAAMHCRVGRGCHFAASIIEPSQFRTVDPGKVAHPDPADGLGFDPAGSERRIVGSSFLAIGVENSECVLVFL